MKAKLLLSFGVHQAVWQEQFDIPE